MDSMLVSIVDGSAKSETQFKIKMNTPLKKLFDTYKKQRNLNGDLRFLFDGKRIQDTDTLTSIEYDPEGKIEVFSLQIAGS